MNEAHNVNSNDLPFFLNVVFERLQLCICRLASLNRKGGNFLTPTQGVNHTSLSLLFIYKRTLKCASSDLIVCFLRSQVTDILQCRTSCRHPLFISALYYGLKYYGYNRGASLSWVDNQKIRQMRPFFQGIIVYQKTIKHVILLYTSQY